MVTYKGKEYDNLHAMCRELKLNYPRINTRLKDGWDLENAITTPPQKKRSAKILAKFLTYNGVVYDNLCDACNALDLSYGVMTKLMARFNNLEKAVKEYYDRLIEYKGKYYFSYKALCDDVGVVYDTFLIKFKDNPNLEEVIEDLLSRSFCKAIPCTVDGEHYNSIAELCRMKGIDYGTFYSRVRRNPSLTLEEVYHKYYKGGL